jgi:opacity protein-like surface antigen
VKLLKISLVSSGGFGHFPPTGEANDSAPPDTGWNHIFKLMKKGNSIAYSLTIASTLLLASQAHCADVVFGAGSGFYAAANVRGNFMDDADLKRVGSSTGGKIRFDDGAGFGVRGGFRFCEWFALEGETGFTGNSVKSMTGASVDADFLQVPFMANALFSFPNTINLFPYVGAGVGGTASIFDADHITVGNTTAVGSESATSFSYQFFAGLEYKITEQISVGAFYNYRTVDGPEWDRSSFLIETGEIRNHSLGVSATFRF